ncbi:MAG: hypothetical protein U5L00_13730 [Desulfovermiculus sp.]|nr:hypothetical protein [Desulfovermiculus sp.]
MTLRYIFIYVLSYLPGKDKSFDRKYGTDTTGIISSGELSISDAKTKHNAIFYLPAPERVTQYMLSSLPIDYTAYTFIDYGSGKGRVLLTASQFPFQKIIGLEISEQASSRCLPKYPEI